MTQNISAKPSDRSRNKVGTAIETSNKWVANPASPLVHSWRWRATSLAMMLEPIGNGSFFVAASPAMRKLRTQAELLWRRRFRY